MPFSKGKAQKHTVSVSRRIHLPQAKQLCHVPVYLNAISTDPSQRKVTRIYLLMQTGAHSHLFSATLQGVVLGNHSRMKTDQQKIMVFELCGS
jgi:hypothetical protein